MQTKSLDIGCGDNPRNIFEADVVYGVDLSANPERNIVAADLALEKIPFDDEFFDYVTAHDFLEHIPRVIYNPSRRNCFVELMNEISRVLKPGGEFLSHTPAWPNEVAFVDPTHVNYISEKTFISYFDHRHNWASRYGFKGKLELTGQEWRGGHLLVTMMKIM